MAPFSVFGTQSDTPKDIVRPARGIDDLYKDQNATWVDLYAPRAVAPYLKLARVDRPIGTWLVLLPGWWGLGLGVQPGELPDPYYLAVFGAGAFLMRSAGCTVNDMWDRKFDSKVARTTKRPLASNQLSMLQAWTFLGAQLTAALWLLLQLNVPTVALGVACVPLVCIYPALKRITYGPQFALGLAMNYGILMGWTVTRGEGKLLPYLRDIVQLPEPVLQPLAQFAGKTQDLLPSLSHVSEGAANHISTVAELLQGVDATTLTPALPLYLGAAGWTVVYDTLYAHQDASDDAKLGLRSTALWFRDNSRSVLSAFTVATGAMWSAAAYLDGNSPSMWLAACGATGILWRQVSTANFEDRLNLNERFVGSKTVGSILLAGVFLKEVSKDLWTILF